MSLWLSVGKILATQNCYHFCNNMAFVQAIQAGRNRDPLLAVYIRNIWLKVSVYDINIKIEHIKSKNNEVADALSKLYSGKPVAGNIIKKMQILTYGSQCFNISLNI